MVQKILKEHLVSGELTPGSEIAIRIDQTLTQDATGTMAYLQFEALGIPRVRTKLSVSYVDHNTLQTGFENADDHRFLQTIAAKKGVFFSRPGNGICHQVHLERFAVPGQTLLGSDSHTPTSGGMGMIAIGAGGLDVACAMAGQPFYLTMPKVMNVVLKGRLGPWVTAKDVILEILRRLTVKGGVGWILEYSGDGVKSLSVAERATITNMGAELGATTSIFPSDEMTRKFLRAQKRPAAWLPLAADPNCTYDGQLEIDLRKLQPLVAAPHSPDKVVPASELKHVKLNQVVIGSCTNSSYHDLSVAAAILRGKKVHPDVSLVIAPGSKQVLQTISKSGALTDLILAGARLIECACGPCIGVGQAPPSGGVSLRTFNRNFKGRSGTADAEVYLCSPEVAAVSAIAGHIEDPRTLKKRITIQEPAAYLIDDSMILPPAKDPDKVEVVRGPNIKPLPLGEPLPEMLRLRVMLKTGDNVTTDDIMPAGAKILALRSNLPAISEYVFTNMDPNFVKRVKAAGGGLIVGGENYGQGSSREHAAMAPMYLGIKAVIAKSFARIHRANLINFGILPLVFTDPRNYDEIEPNAELELPYVRQLLESGKQLIIKNVARHVDYAVEHNLTPRQVQIILAGGLLNYVKSQG
ncbi:MAG: aconitate hydratase [Candidatus Sumerlaeia bacterium]|nr:aconitate hydratase [Candidatus Sumerlaeia bacterium]